MTYSSCDERIAVREAASNAQADSLAATAERLYPDNQYLQTEWLRAVRVVRSTKGGWKLDNPVPRQTAAAH